VTIRSETEPRQMPLRRILYCSTSTSPAEQTDLGSILQQSRHNNAIDGVTGILWSDGAKFLQVFEGPVASVDATWQRIKNDPRHHEIVVIQDIGLDDRGFGYWSMVHRSAGEAHDDHDRHIRRLLRDADPAIADSFETMLAAPR